MSLNNSTLAGARPGCEGDKEAEKKKWKRALPERGGGRKWDLAKKKPPGVPGSARTGCRNSKDRVQNKLLATGIYGVRVRSCGSSSTEMPRERPLYVVFVTYGCHRSQLRIMVPALVFMAILFSVVHLFLSLVNSSRDAWKERLNSSWIL